MNKRQARIFALASTAISALIFLILTVDSHRQFPTLTNAETITPQVTSGKDVWHKYNCINCHTLFGEGAYYAPDLTKITQHRGEAYLKAFIRDPSNFYDEQKHRRLMPKQDLSDQEIDDLIAFLDWVSKVDNQDWPPRPILVTGSGGLGLSGVRSEPASVTADASDDPIALGEVLFQSVTPSCSACHSTSPGVELAGPTMAGLAARAVETLASPEYGGEATDAEGYIRESILAPSAHVVPGERFSADGVSFMPNTYGDSLSEEQTEQLVAYLMSLK